MNLQISNIASDKVNSSILISGVARSGTTIVGKLISSFDGVEYSFEPPMMFTLISLISSMPQWQWKLLTETYLYEEFLVNALSGRSINCNLSDDSSIFKVKDKSEIESRLKESLGKIESEHLAVSRTLAFKIPDVIPYLPEINKYYPKMRMVIVRREAIGALNSLVAKKWFSSDSSISNLIWPFRKIDNVNIPFWVRESDNEMWLKLSELDRAAYYYIRMNETISEPNNVIEIKYTHLLTKPQKVIFNLAEELELNYGTKTNDIISSIKPTNKERNFNLLEQISDQFRESVKHYSDASI